jgi:cell division protein FtsN
LRVATIQGKGRWYRVLLGGYGSRDDAEQAGDRYRSQHVIDTFVISKVTE